MNEYKLNGDDWDTVSNSYDPALDENYQAATWSENLIVRPLAQWDEYSRPWTEDDQIDTLLYISRLGK
jgi:hypothetical protein